ncbi:hypothetical protein ACFSSC_07215 [Corynebacterium mendelii]|uniref:Uncharacterized protein n=1 Tax=Corynebacterium mendelii TaxID=2765362 RepID=A0A939E1T3_9CORY|nr:hypothetical protein [Corynebacterium mendelii]MBN9644880.1 hypothetical protein [Corynebacterium mendelii]
MRFEPDDKELGRIVQPAVEECADSLNREFQTLYRCWQGQPQERIKEAIREVFTRHGGTVSEKELTDYARLISDGTNIRFLP